MRRALGRDRDAVRQECYGDGVRDTRELIRWANRCRCRRDAAT